MDEGGSGKGRVIGWLTKHLVTRMAERDADGYERHSGTARVKETRRLRLKARGDDRREGGGAVEQDKELRFFFCDEEEEDE